MRYSSGSKLHNPEAFGLYLKLWLIFSPLFLRVSKCFSLIIIKHRIRQYQNYQWSNKPAKPRHNKCYKETIPLDERSLESRYVSAAVSYEERDISKAYQNIVFSHHDLKCSVFEIYRGATQISSCEKGKQLVKEAALLSLFLLYNVHRRNT